MPRGDIPWRVGSRQCDVKGVQPTHAHTLEILSPRCGLSDGGLASGCRVRGSSDGPIAGRRPDVCRDALFPRGQRGVRPWDGRTARFADRRDAAHRAVRDAGDACPQGTADRRARCSALPGALTHALQRWRDAPTPAARQHDVRAARQGRSQLLDRDPAARAGVARTGRWRVVTRGAPADVGERHREPRPPRRRDLPLSRR